MHTAGEESAYEEGRYDGKLECNKEIERLKKDVKKYGRHTSSCKHFFSDIPCTCGLEQALKDAE